YPAGSGVDGRLERKAKTPTFASAFARGVCGHLGCPSQLRTRRGSEERSSPAAPRCKALSHAAGRAARGRSRHQPQRCETAGEATARRQEKKAFRSRRERLARTAPRLRGLGLGRRNRCSGSCDGWAVNLHGLEVLIEVREPA